MVKMVSVVCRSQIGREPRWSYRERKLHVLMMGRIGAMEIGQQLDRQTASETPLFDSKGDCSVIIVGKEPQGVRD